MAGRCVEGVSGLLLKSSSAIFPVTGDIVLIRVVRQYASSPGLVEERVCKHLRLVTKLAFFSAAKILRESLARSSRVLGITDWLATTLFSLVFGVLYWCTGVLNPLPCGVSSLPPLPPLPSPLSVGPLSPPLKSNKVPLPPEAKPRAFLS